MQECRLLDVFHTEPRIIQEPQVWIALTLGGVSPAYIRRPLYKYYLRADSITETSLEYDRRLRYVDQFHILVENTFRDLKKPSAYESFLLSAGRLASNHYYLALFPQYDEDVIAQRFVELLSTSGFGFDKVNMKSIKDSGCHIAVRFVSDKLIGREARQDACIQRMGNGRVVAYAGYSRAAKRVEKGLLNSDIRPDVFWDIRAEDGDSIRGVPVTRPDFGSLSSYDTVLVLLWNNIIADTVTNQIKTESDCGQIWYYDEILDYLVRYYYD